MDKLPLVGIFKQLFPLYDIDKSVDISDTSVMIITSTGLEFIFTFKAIDDWRFETVKAFGNEVLEDLK